MFYPDLKKLQELFEDKEDCAVQNFINAFQADDLVAMMYVVWDFVDSNRNEDLKHLIAYAQTFYD